MTTKDKEYYLQLDLKDAAATIRTLGEQRANSSIFGDVLISLDMHAHERDVTEDELRSIAGTPDDVRETTDGTVLVYCWIGRHGPFEYSSATPFLVRDGIVKGVADLRQAQWFNHLLEQRQPKHS